MLLAANFHYVRETFEAPFPAIFGVTPAEFENQLEVLGKAGEFVSPLQIDEAARGGAALPDHAIAVTFDDGLAEQFDLAWPILKRKGIPALFFVNTRCIAESRVETVHKLHLLRSRVAPETIRDDLEAYVAGIDLAPVLDPDRARRQYPYDTPEAAVLKYTINMRLSPQQQEEFVDFALKRHTAFEERKVSRALYMTKEVIENLDRSGAIGTHGHTHAPLGSLSGAEAERQIDLSIDHLSSWGCCNLRSLSYPYGSREAVSQAAARRAQARGVSFAFTMERAVNRDLTRPFLLARFSNSDLPGGNAAKLAADDLFEKAAVSRWSWDRGE